MFLFIFPFVIFAPVDTLLSIHLMFLFILFLELLLFLMGYFNTSHVLIYPCTWRKWNGNEKFQYISCSYLSVGQMMTAFGEGNFNTSHVLIYPSCSRCCKTRDCYFNTSHVLIYLYTSVLFAMSYEFQYISCSYLSDYYAFNDIWKILFQYISCSYLSTCLFLTTS